MSAKEMYDYLDIVSPDNDVTLSVTPQDVLTERGTKNQEVHVSDDNSEERISFSDDSIFYVLLQWSNISESDAGTILDFFHDASKGNGITETFKWDHPTDGHTYVVRFDSTNVDRQIQLATQYGIAQVRLKVVGRIAD